MNNNVRDKHGIKRKIIDILLHNAKTPYREIASKLNISIGTVTNKIKKLEKDGIIKRHTIGVDYEKIGYAIEVLIFVKIAKGKFSTLFENYINNSSVFTVFDITGTFDSVMSAKFKDRRELNAFLKKLQEEDYVNYTNTNMILNIRRGEKVI
jgi:DNA-binding Lrp family transcriptional regulator